MSYRIGSVEASKLYYGSTQVKRLYKGSQLIWEPPVVAPTFQSTDFSDVQGGISNWAFKYLGGTIALADGGTIAVDGKVMNLVATQSAEAFAWSVPGALTDCEVLCKYQQSSGTVGQAGLALRLGGTSTARTGYLLSARPTSLRLDRYDASSLIALTVAEAPYPTTKTETKTSLTDYWLRARAVGSVLYGKSWLASEVEPVDWEVAAVDNTVASGQVGFYSFTTLRTNQLDYFAVSDGGAIPMPT